MAYATYALFLIPVVMPAVLLALLALRGAGSTSGEV